MSVVDESISSASRADKVPIFKEPTGSTGTERQRLRWVPRGTVQIVQGLKTVGGFYMYRPKNKSLSFAVDETLAVGRAENARSLPLRPGQCVSFRQLEYRQLHSDQRAAYLRWVSGGSPPLDTFAFSARLHVAALEWRLGIDRVDPGEIALECSEMLDCPARIDQAPLVTLLGWATYFQSRNLHIEVVEELIAAGCTMLDASMLRLFLLDCAEAKRPVRPEVALVIQKVFGGSDWRFSDESLQRRFLERFRVLYPNGFLISAGPHCTQVEYRIHCIELREERCRLIIPDTVENTLAALREVTAPLLGGTRLDPVRLRSTAEETLRSQALLAKRSEKYSEPHAVPAPLKIKAPPALNETMLEILRALIEDGPEWSRSEFHALARARGVMPLAVHEKLNGWAIETFGETLLQGESSVVINTNLIKEIQEK